VLAGYAGMRRVVRVSKVGLATTGLLVIAGLATTALVTRSARAIAGDEPYCIQVADTQADYRPARTLLELSGLMMRAKIFDQHHAILVVGDETHPSLFHWSYHKARFVPGVLNAAIPGHEPVLSCESRRNYIGTLPALWAPHPESTYVHFSEHRIFRVPTSYQPRWSGGSSAFLAIATSAPDFAPLTVPWVSLAQSERVWNVAFIAWNPTGMRDLTGAAPAGAIGGEFGLQEAPAASSKRYVVQGQPSGANATLIDCPIGSKAHPAMCRHRFLSHGHEFDFVHRPEDLPNWRQMQEHLVSLFASFEAAD
jgi:hypothetical protein